MKTITSVMYSVLFPAIFLLAAVALEKIKQINKAGKLLSLLLLIIFVGLSILNSPLKYSPNFQLKHTAQVDERIVQEIQGKPFNLGMIAKQNYDAGYRYFLEKWGNKAVEIDAQRSAQTITEQLFVVCEVQDCQPINHPQAEIANFGWAKIEQTWEFPWGVRLFKLVHTEK